MKILLFIPLLALFVVPWEFDPASSAPVSHSNQSPSAPTADLPVNQHETIGETEEPVVHTPAPAQAAAVAQATETAVETTEVILPPDPVPQAEVDTPLDFVARMEAEILLLTNTERAAAGLSPLAPHARLRTIAAAHSADMLENDYFSHENLDACSSSCRASNSGYRWRRIGENIYMMSGYRLSPERAAAMVVDGWMESPGHRANILGAAFEESGIGVVTDGISIYVTALYATPR